MHRQPLWETASAFAEQTQPGGLPVAAGFSQLRVGPALSCLPSRTAAALPAAGDVDAFHCPIHVQAVASGRGSIRRTIQLLAEASKVDRQFHQEHVESEIIQPKQSPAIDFLV